MEPTLQKRTGQNPEKLSQAPPFFKHQFQFMKDVVGGQ
jgi:hypothetical protein